MALLLSRQFAYIFASVLVMHVALVTLYRVFVTSLKQVTILKLRFRSPTLNLRFYSWYT